MGDDREGGRRHGEDYVGSMEDPEQMAKSCDCDFVTKRKAGTRPLQHLRCNPL